jgi:hypothetical protein
MHVKNEFGKMDEDNKIFAYNMHSQLENNILSLVYAEKCNNIQKQNVCAAKEKIILETINKASPEQFKCFTKLLFAEFKECMYQSMADDYFENIVIHYERIIYNNDEWNNTITFHSHDASHYLFEGVEYKFYTMMESKGLQILNVAVEPDEIY